MKLWPLLVLSAALPLAAQDGLRLYLPFDGSPVPAYAAGDAQQDVGPLRFEPGRQGDAVRLTGDLRLRTAGNLNPAAGTFAVWACFDEAGNLPAGRYLFCVYGDRLLAESWARNRFSVEASGGQLHFTVYDQAGKTSGVAAPIITWAPKTWHHVAVTWTGFGTPGAAALRLYLDGKLAAERTGLTITLGPVGDLLDLGRDSDGSPDYANGLLDELYLYDRALPAEVIAAAAARPAQEPPAEAPAARLAANAGWAEAALPFRAQVRLPAALTARRDAAFLLPLGFAAAAAGLTGTPSALDPGSLRVVDAQGKVLPSALDGDRLLFRVPGVINPDEARTATIYFGTVRYDLSTPLQARRVAVARAAGTSSVTLPDYATEAFGRGWEFAKDEAGIDQWGNKPEYIKHRIEDGVLVLDVDKDPWFIWGNMWGQVGQTKQKVDIDLSRYHLLEIRLQQSVADATWEVLGRPGASDQLLMYKFGVHGTGWQTVRLDLAKEPRWRGHLSAFRIDPTDGVRATVKIAWVRLLAVDDAVLDGVETVGQPTGVTARLVVEAPAALTAGEAAPVAVQALDAQGRPVAGQPVSLTVTGDATAALAAAPHGAGYGLTPQVRTGLTGADGRLKLSYTASQRVAVDGDKLAATAPFTGAAPATTIVRTQAGPATQVAFAPVRPVLLPAGVNGTELRVQVADRFANPVASGPKTVILTAPAGATVAPATVTTAADGSATCRVTLDPAKLWVAQVTAQAGEWAGTSPAICVTPAGKGEAFTLAANGDFRLGGRPWMPLGGFYANWVGDVPEGKEAGWKVTSFTAANDAQRVAWLRFLAEQGVTAMRFMLRTHRPDGMEPMDIGGRVNPELYAEVLHYLDLARPFGIRFLLVLHEDYTKPMYFSEDPRRKYCLPAWKGLEGTRTPQQRRFIDEDRLLDSIDQKYTDADAMACQDLYARQLIGLLKGNPQVFGYELENEMVAPPLAWVDHACDVIRSVDPATPICMSHGGGGLHTGDPYFWRTKSKVDFYTYHLYPAGMSTPEADYGAVTAATTRYGRMAGRCFFGESAGDEFFNGGDEPARRRMARDLIWFSLINGNPGCFFWNNRGAEVNEFALARKLSDRVGLATWTLRRAPIAVQVAHPLENDRWFRTPAGLEALKNLARYEQHYLAQGAEFDHAWTAAGYTATAPLDKFAPVPAPSRPIAPPAGFHAATAAREDGREGLTYVRCFAGVEKLVTGGSRPATLYLRGAAAVPCTLTLGLGQGTFSLVVTDLVTGAERTVQAAGNGTVDLGTTDHDFVVWWKRAG